jgi:hypothetical protein
MSSIDVVSLTGALKTSSSKSASSRRYATPVSVASHFRHDPWSPQGEDPVASKASGKIPRMATPPPKGIKAPSRLQENAYRLLMLAAVTVVLVGTVVYHWLEDWSWVDSLYFSVVTGSTVGFGDLAPTKDSSKLFTIVYIIFAVSIIGTFLSMRFRARTTVRVDKHRSGPDEE